MEVKLILTIAVLLLATSVHGGRNGKHGKNGKNIGKMMHSCMGQPLNLTNLTPAIDDCLDIKIKEVMEASANSNKGKKGKGRKNKEKKMAKLSKKLRKKCMADCKWNSFGLIPNTTEDGFYDSSEIDMTDFLEVFPEEAKESLQTGIMACYNSSKIIPLRKGKGMNVAKQMCSRNKKLVKCFQRTMKKSCRSGRQDKGTAPPAKPVSPQSPVAPHTNASSTGNGTMKAPTSGTTTVPASTHPALSTTVKPASIAPSTPGTNDNNDDTVEDDDDDEEDEDDDDDEEEDSEEESPKAIPSTSVDMTKPITK